MDFLYALILVIKDIVIPGLVFGSQLALGALGVTLIYSILRFATFAHSESMAFGAGIMVLCLQATAWLGLSSLVGLLVGLPIVIAVTIGMLLAMNYLVFRFYQQARSVAVIFTVVSVGVMFITNSLVRFLVGVQARPLIDKDQKFFSYWSQERADAAADKALERAYDVERTAEFISSEGWVDLKVREMKRLLGETFGVEKWQEAFTITVPQAATLLIAILAVTALFYFLNRTRSGKAMRAFSDNEDLAQLSGINPQRVIQMTWAVAGVLTVLAGVLYGMDKGFTPFTYVLLLLPLFASAVVGGIGSPQGAIVGGFVIAFSELVITYNWKAVFNYLLPESLEFAGNVQVMTTENKFAVTFVVLVLVLIVRPTGIFKGKVL